MATKAQAEPFHKQLRTTLNSFEDAEWLGNHSPLAAPYFLGTALELGKKPQTARGRGETLQKVLRNAAAKLWRDSLPHTKNDLETIVNEERQTLGSRGSRYYYMLLDLRYFRTYFPPAVSPRSDDELAIREHLGLGRGTFFNHLKAAREALAEALLAEIRPTFRLEQPIQPSQPLIGFEQKLRQTLAHLQENKTVTVSGMGGVGKSTLGGAVAHQWSEGSVFWFTISPTFNDQLSSLIFSLGYFLHTQGASGLWSQLVADGGKIDNPDLALAHFRGDVHALKKRPLFCIDEIDYLQSSVNQHNPNHAQMITFLQQLQSIAPLLLIGQRPLIESDSYFELGGFPEGETAVFLQNSNITHSAEELTHLQQYTGGNPRLLNLCASLYQSTQSLRDVLNDLPQTAALQALFDRIWQRLTGEEQQLLLGLSVFRSPAPDDAWEKSAKSLRQLIERQLVQHDGQGGVFLLPIYRDLIYADHQRLSTELREQAHIAAAIIRYTRGEYTAAAYHYQQADEPQKALHVWFPHRQQEIQRGQTATALAIFQQLSMRRLDKSEQNALTLLRAELYALAGNPDKGKNEIQTYEWVEDNEITAQAQLLHSEFLNALGFPEAALEQNEQGIETTARLLNQLVKFRNQRTITYVQQRQLKEAWQETRIAQYEAERLQGFLQSEQGHYDEAYLSYQRSLALAKSIGEAGGTAQINRDLAIMLCRHGRLELAQEHAQEAIEYYQQAGDRFSVEKVRNTLSGIYFQGGQFEKAISVAEQALPFFQEANLPYWTSVTAATLSEAYYEVGELEKAASHANIVLQYEEKHSYPYALYTLGLVARAKEESEQAHQFFREATTIAEDNGDSFMAAYAWRMQGQTLHDQNRPDEAKKAVRTALEQFESLDIAPEIAATRKLLEGME